LSSAGATAGLSAGFFDIASGLAFVALAHAFLPVYRNSRAFTLPEWTEHRFGPRVRIYLSILALLIYVVNRISATLYCGGLIFSVTLGLNEWVSIGILLVATGLTVTMGGLHSILVIENLNTVLLLVGGFLTLGFALAAAGGWSEVVASIESGTGAARQAGIPASFAHIWSGGDLYPWPGLLLGGPWLVAWFHLAEQEMVQRGLSAGSAGDAALGCVLAGLLKLTIPFTWAVPGMVARYLYPAELGCDPAAPLGSECHDANKAFPVLIMRVLPTGLLGLMLAAMLAAVLSVLASTFNSASTIFVFDVASKLSCCIGEAPRSTRGRAEAEAVAERSTDDDAAATPAGEPPHTSSDDRRLLLPAAGHGSADSVPPVDRATSRERRREPRDEREQAGGGAATDTSLSGAPDQGVTEVATCEAPEPEPDQAALHDARLVMMGRVWVGVMVILGVAWIPALGRLSDSLYVAMQTLNALLAPPVLAVFVLGVLWPRVNETGALAGLVCGHAPGLVRLVLSTVDGGGDPAASDPSAGKLGGVFTGVGYLYFAAMEGALSVAVAVAVSMWALPGRSPVQVAPFVLPAALSCCARCCPGVGLCPREGTDAAAALAAVLAGRRAWKSAAAEEEAELVARAEASEEAARSPPKGFSGLLQRCCGRPADARQPQHGHHHASDLPARDPIAPALAGAAGSPDEGHGLLAAKPLAPASVPGASAPSAYTVRLAAVRAGQARLHFAAIVGSAVLVVVVAVLFVVLA